MLATAATLAVARVVAGVHYPSDVIAGSIMGAAIGRGSRAVAERRSSADRKLIRHERGAARHLQTGQP